MFYDYVAGNINDNVDERKKLLADLLSGKSKLREEVIQIIRCADRKAIATNIL